jgi:hypothetical protein
MMYAHMHACKSIHQRAHLSVGGQFTLVVHLEPLALRREKEDSEHRREGNRGSEGAGEPGEKGE